MDQQPELQQLLEEIQPRDQKSSQAKQILQKKLDALIQERDKWKGDAMLFAKVAKASIMVHKARAEPIPA